MTVVELMGAPGSPYTRKMLALMRYRHIPYRISWQSITSPGDMEAQKSTKAQSRTAADLLSARRKG